MSGCIAAQEVRVGGEGGGGAEREHSNATAAVVHYNYGQQAGDLTEDSVQGGVGPRRVERKRITAGRANEQGFEIPDTKRNLS